MIKENFIQFHNFSLSLLQLSKFSGNITDSLKLRKFQTHNMKVMAKDKQVNIKVTYEDT
jgi:hypothetical protein